MTDPEIPFDQLVRRMDAVESALETLRQSVHGALPTPPAFMSLDDRLESVNRTLAGPVVDFASPAVVSGEEANDPQLELPVVEIEWGKVTAAPNTTPTATIELHPCDKDGTEYGSAAHIFVYIRDDRSTVDLSERSWTTSTILSFIRFPWDVGSAPTVVGVLVGEGQGVQAEWFKAYEAWVYVAAANGCYIMCHPCTDQTGAGEVTGMNVKVWLPRGSREQDPNVADDAVIAAMKDSAGVYVALDPALDERVYRSIKMWHGITAPAGWGLCDGSAIKEGYVRPDLRARFIAGYHSAEGHGATADILGKTSEYASIGAKGGTAWHGMGRYAWDDCAYGSDANDHPDHADHVHEIGVGGTYVQSGGNLSHTEAYTASQVSSGGHADMHFRHGGLFNPWPSGDAAPSPTNEYFSLADTDNRPAYYTLAFIMRLDNSKNFDVDVPAELTIP